MVSMIPHRPTWVVLGVVVLLFVSIVPCPAESVPGLKVVPLENRTGNPALDRLASSIQTTLDLNIRLLSGEIEVSGVSGTVLGWIDRSPQTGIIGVSITIVDRIANEVIAEIREEASSLLDVFEAADRLGERVLEVVAGRRMEYGSLAIGAGSVWSLYRVRLNDQDLGEGAQRLSTLVSGSYDVEVYQDRMLGSEKILAARVTVVGNEETVLPVNVPYLSVREERHLGEIDHRIREAEREGRIGDCRTILDETIANLSRPELAAVSEGYTIAADRYRLWRDAVSSETTGTERIRDAATLLHLEALGLAPDWSAIFRMRQRSVAQTILDRYRSIPWRSIQIDGEFSDWDGIAPLVNEDSRGRFFPPSAGTPAMKLSEAYLVQDDTFYYMRIVLCDDDIKRFLIPYNEVHYKIIFVTDLTTWSHLAFHVEWKSSERRWRAFTFFWTPDRIVRLADGSVRIAGNELEARFPRTRISTILERDRTYRVRAETFTTFEVTDDWLMHHVLEAEVVY